MNEVTKLKIANCNSIPELAVMPKTDAVVRRIIEISTDNYMRKNRIDVSNIMYIKALIAYEYTADKVNPKLRRLYRSATPKEAIAYLANCTSIKHIARLDRHHLVDLSFETVVMSDPSFDTDIKEVAKQKLLTYLGVLVVDPAIITMPRFRVLYATNNTTDTVMAVYYSYQNPTTEMFEYYIDVYNFKTTSNSWVKVQGMHVNTNPDEFNLPSSVVISERGNDILAYYIEHDWAYIVHYTTEDQFMSGVSDVRRICNTKFNDLSKYPVSYLEFQSICQQRLQLTPCRIRVKDIKQMMSKYAFLQAISDVHILNQYGARLTAHRVISKHYNIVILAIEFHTTKVLIAVNYMLSISGTMIATEVIAKIDTGKHTVIDIQTNVDASIMVTYSLTSTPESLWDSYVTIYQRINDIPATGDSKYIYVPMSVLQIDSNTSMKALKGLTIKLKEHLLRVNTLSGCLEYDVSDLSNPVLNY